MSLQWSKIRTTSPVNMVRLGCKPKPPSPEGSGCLHAMLPLVTVDLQDDTAQGVLYEQESVYLADTASLGAWPASFLALAHGWSP